MTLGERGIINIAQSSVKKNSQETAREKLELALDDLLVQKYNEKDYDENEYINNYLKNKNMSIYENIVTVDDWNFEIDRSLLTIKTNLGSSDVRISKEVKEYLGKNEKNKYIVSLLVKVESNIKIESIDFENEDGTMFTITTQKNTLAKDMQIELDKEYRIVVKTANGRTINETIIEKSVENIKTVEELVAFRDKVNTGLTYEGKTINLVSDLDLSNICGENINGKEISWEPIGNYGTDTTHIFKGKFNGNGHIINNIYINTTSSFQGLFGYVQKGTIIGVIIGNTQDKNSTESNSKISIKGGSYVGAITGTSDNSTIQNCGNNINITCSDRSVGGVVGSSNYDEIIGVYNKGDVIGATHSVGGIVGGGRGDNIKFSYNTGNIKGNYIVGGIVGSEYSGEVKHCYNIGEISRFLFIICACRRCWWGFRWLYCRILL